RRDGAERRPRLHQALCLRCLRPDRPAAVLPDDGTLRQGPLFRGGSDQLRRGGVLQAPDTAVTACRGQDSNLHGGCPPRDFKSATTSGQDGTRRHKTPEIQAVRGAERPPVVRLGPPSVVLSGYSLGTASRARRARASSPTGRRGGPTGFGVPWG